MIMANELNSVAEEPETTTSTLPWDTVELPKPARPMISVTDNYGVHREREMNDYEFRKWTESNEDTAMRQEAAKAQAGTGSLTRHLMTRPRVVVPVNTGEDAPFTVSPTINEQRVISLTVDEGEQSYLQTSIGFLKSTRESLERVSAAYEALRADATLLPEARSAKISTAADKAHDNAVGALQKTLNLLDKQITHVETELRTPLTSAAHTPGMSELRAVLREMKTDQRRKAIEQAIAADSPTQQQKDLISAALGGHYLMSGLDELMHQTLTLQLNRKRSPHLVRRMEQLQRSREIVESVNPVVLTKAYEGAQRASFRKAKNLRALSDKAQAALDAITGG
jgi:hypothetical protein